MTGDLAKPALAFDFLQHTSFELGDGKCIVFDDSDHEIRSKWAIIRIKKFDLRGISYKNQEINHSGKIIPIIR